MQVRLDVENAKAIKQQARTYQRIFKRRKSYGTIVNEILRDSFGKETAFVVSPYLANPNLDTNQPVKLFKRTQDGGTVELK